MARSKVNLSFYQFCRLNLYSILNRLKLEKKDKFPSVFVYLFLFLIIRLNNSHTQGTRSFNHHLLLTVTRCVINDQF